MFPHSAFLNRSAVISNLSTEKGVPGMQELLASLSSKELAILRKNPDLIEEVAKFLKAPFMELVDRLESMYGIKPEEYDDNIWIDLADQEKRVPQHLKNPHTGWWFCRSQEFQDWIKEFFLQEIRINLWLRYLAHKKESPARAPTGLEKIWGDYGGYI